MLKKEKFEEALAELLEFALANENKLTIKEINDYFSHMQLDEDKMRLIYAYFAANQITITDYDQVQSNDVAETGFDKDMSQEDQIFGQTVDFYLEELNDIPEYKEEQKTALLKEVLNGQEESKSKLIESYLRDVIDVARGYQNKGILLGDLIQEGNMGLIFGADSFTGTDPEEFDKFIKQSIVSSITEALKEQSATYQTADKLAQKANHLSEVSKKLADDLGREATIEELSKAMNASEEEIRDIMKVSLDAISLKTAN